MPVVKFTSETGRFFAKRAAEARAAAALYRRTHPPPKAKQDYSGLTLTRIKVQLDVVNDRLMGELTRNNRPIDPLAIDRLAGTQARLVELYQSMSNPKNGNGATAHPSSPDDVSPVEQ